MSVQQKSFQWAEIHAELNARIDQLGSAIDDEDHVRSILLERSAALAEAASKASPAQASSRILIFELGGERYALPLGHSREVAALPKPAPLPGMGQALLGVISWRGEFIVVFDLKAMLDLPQATETPASWMIVLSSDVATVALAVDALVEIRRIDPNELQTGEQLRTKHAELYQGTTTDAVAVIDGEALSEILRQTLEAA